MDQVAEDDPESAKLDKHLAALLNRPFFQNMKTTYSLLFGLRRKHIPTLHSTIRFLDASSPGLDTTVLIIPIEFVPGTNLSRMDLTTIDLNTVCSDAVDVVNTYSDINVVSRGVRLENVIVKLNALEQ